MECNESGRVNANGREPALEVEIKFAVSVSLSETSLDRNEQTIESESESMSAIVSEFKA
jgi:uncharacterized protein YigA (DUF484 family)